MAKHNKKRISKRNGGGKKRKNKTNKQKPKIIYVYASNNTQPAQNPGIQQPLPQPQQPQPGVFTWGDAGKLLAVDVGAILVQKGIEEAMD